MSTPQFFKRSILATLVSLACMSAPSQAQTATSNQLVLESSTMDLKADPCTQFFEYANGLWLKNNPIPADRSRYSAFDEVTERNMIALKKSRKQRRRVTINTAQRNWLARFTPAV
jgi:putative endopeptidase